MKACHHMKWIAICTSTIVFTVVKCGDYTLSMDTSTSCTNAHYYQAGDVFLASARNTVHGGHCPLTFIQSGSRESYKEPCSNLCVKIITYSMKSCLVKLTYHDGLNDFSPVTFDCRTFPPVIWCSSKNNIKVTVSEMKNYAKEKKGYTMSFEVSPFCGITEVSSTDSSVVAQPKSKQSPMSQTAVIVGAIVGTISILFVIGWLMYCYKKRHSDTTTSQSSFYDRTDRSRGSTPNQQNQTTNRYAPIRRNQPANQTTVPDRYVNNPKGRPSLDQTGSTDYNNPRVPSPFYASQTQPNQKSANDQIHQQVLYSDIARGPQPGEKWYPMATLGPTSSAFSAPSKFTPQSAPSDHMSQYMTRNQVYDYPADGEMHTTPIDQRYVVYDFDFKPEPLKKIYSTEKPVDAASFRQYPIIEADRSGFKGTTNKMPLVFSPAFDSTTAESTSDIDSSEDTTTDDQSRVGMHHFTSSYSFNKPQPIRPNISDSRMYPPNKCQLIENSSVDNFQLDAHGTRPRADSSTGFRPPVDKLDSFREGPVPQVPPMPKEFQRTPGGELPWPHGPPPPYSEDNDCII